MTGPSIQSTTGPSTSGPLISDASLVPTIPMISTGMPLIPPLSVAALCGLNPGTCVRPRGGSDAHSPR